jgi:hypothetical protein
MVDLGNAAWNWIRYHNKSWVGDVPGCYRRPVRRWGRKVSCAMGDSRLA